MPTENMHRVDQQTFLACLRSQERLRNGGVTCQPATDGRTQWTIRDEVCGMTDAPAGLARHYWIHSQCLVQTKEAA